MKRQEASYNNSLLKENGSFRVRKGRGKTDFFNILFALFCLSSSCNFFSLPAIALEQNALPTGYQTVSGNVSYQQNNNTLNVNSSSNSSIVNYQSFNVGSNATVNFNLSSSSAAILNRVTGNTGSEIFGTINSNGQVFLVNSNGILFGTNAQVNVSSLVASTLDIKDSDFTNGNYHFQNASGGIASIVNNGTINGSTAFLSSAIQNNGTINAPQGQINFAVGDSITVTLDNGVMLDVVVDESLKQKVDGINEGISNIGSLIADGGSIKLQAKLQDAFYESVVNNEGLIQATGLVNNNGSIELVGYTDTATGLVKNNGNLLANNENGKGGTIKVSGDQILLADTSNIEASGLTAGGEVLVGGNYLGKNAETPNSQLTYVDKGSSITANAIETGNGGKVIVWSDKDTVFNGSISAQGGESSGDGGFIETSGKENLAVGKNAQVNALAKNGKAGDWLLDPRNITIQDGGADTPTLAQLADASDTTSDFIIDADMINNAAANVNLIASQDITVSEDISLINTGVGLSANAGNDITVNSSITTQNGNVQLLANNNVNVNSSVSSGGGTVEITADNDLDGSGDANFNGSSTVVDSSNANISIAGNNVLLNDATINAGSADIDITAITGNVSQTTGSVYASTLDLNLNGSNTTVANLDSVSNDVNNLQVNSADGNVSYTDANDFSVSANLDTNSDLVKGDLSITSQGAGNISQSGIISGGTLTVTTDSGEAVLFTDDNDFDNIQANSTSGIIGYGDINQINILGANVGTGTFGIGSLAPGDVVTQTGSIIANNLVVVTDTGNALLNNPNNDVNNLTLTSLSGGNLEYTDVNDVTLDSYTAPFGSITETELLNELGVSSLPFGVAANNLSITSGAEAGIGILLNAPVTATTLNLSTDDGVSGGIATISQNPGADINAINLNVTSENGNVTLNNSGNDVSTLSVLAEGALVEYTDANGFDLTQANLNLTGGSSVTELGGLTLSSEGVLGEDVTQTGSISGVNNLTLNLNEGSALLDNASNDVRSLTASSNGGNVTYTDSSGFSVTSANLNADNIGANGDLTLTSSGLGNISQLGGSIVNVNQLTATTENGNINLTNTSNDVTSIQLLSDDGNASFVDANGFDVVSVNLNSDGDTVLGNLSLTAQGNSNITQSGGVSGINNFNVSTEGGSLNFNNNIGNDVQSLNASTNEGNIQFRDNNGFSVISANLDVDNTGNRGSIVLRSQNGDINQTGATSGITGAERIRVRTTNGNVDLTTQDNDTNEFSIRTNNGNIAYTDTDGVELIDSDLNGGSLSLTSDSTGIDLNRTANTGISLNGDITGTADIDLIANNGTINQSGGFIEGTSLGLEIGGSSADVSINDSDFASVSFNEIGTGSVNSITYTERDGYDITSSNIGNGNLNLGVNTVATADNGDPLGPETVITNSSDLSGNALSINDFDASLIDVDFSTIAANGTDINVSVSDTDGIKLLDSDLGNGSLTVTTQTTGANTNGDPLLGFQPETNLDLDGNILSGTVNLTANSGNITQQAGSTIQGNNLNLELSTNGSNANIIDADFTNLTANSNNGDVTYVDADGVTVGNSNLGNGSYSVLASSPGLTSNNTVVENTLNLDGDIQAETMNLFAFSNTDISQLSGSVLGNNLNILTVQGNATLESPTNDINNLISFSLDGSTSFVDGDGGFTVIAANQDLDATGGTGDLSLTALNGGNIDQFSNIIADELSVNVVDGGDAILLNPNNDINTFAANATGASTANSQVGYLDSDDVSIAQSELNGGDLGIGALNAGNITQASVAGDITTVGGVNANELIVLNEDGGDTDLTTQINDVEVLSAYAFGTNTENTQVRFIDSTGGFNLAESDLGNGDLEITALDGGTIEQFDRPDPGPDRDITFNGATYADELSVNVVDGGDTILLNPNNDVNTFATNATGANTINSQVTFLENDGFEIGSSNMQEGDLVIGSILGDITQSTVDKDIVSTGPILADELVVGVFGGGDAVLTRIDNDVNIFSGLALVDSESSQVTYQDSNDVDVAFSFLEDGDLDLRVRDGGNINQTTTNGDVTIAGGIFANELEVTLRGGGDANLTRVDNDVEVFSAQASGANNSNTQVLYTDSNSFNVARSNLRDGDLGLTVLNGGTIDQNSLSATDRDITSNGRIDADELTVDVVDGSDASLTRNNRVNIFSANASGVNTNESQVVFANAEDVKIASSEMEDGDLGLIARNGSDITQATAPGDLTTVGGINANELSVTMVNGGDADLTTQVNNVQIFSAIARGSNTGETIVEFVDSADGFNLANSNMREGDLTLQTLGKGDINQDSYGMNSGNRDITRNGPLNVDELNLVTDEGNVTLDRSNNDIQFVMATSNQGDVTIIDLDGIGVYESDLGSGIFELNTSGDINILGDIDGKSIILETTNDGDINLDANTLTASNKIDITSDGDVNGRDRVDFPKLVAPNIFVRGDKVADPNAPLGLTVNIQNGFILDRSNQTQSIFGELFGLESIRNFLVQENGFFLYPVLVNPGNRLQRILSALTSNPIVSKSVGGGFSSLPGNLVLTSSGTYLVYGDKSDLKLFDDSEANDIGSYLLATGQTYLPLEEDANPLNTKFVKTMKQIIVDTSHPEEITITSGTIFPLQQQETEQIYQKFTNEVKAEEL